jgi:pyrimidine operon attenuation protein/uracil phosphoribosyltransferase
MLDCSRSLIEPDELDRLYQRIATDFRGKPLLIVAVVSDGVVNRVTNADDALLFHGQIPQDGIVLANDLTRSTSIIAGLRYLRAQYLRDAQSSKLEIVENELSALPIRGHHVLLVDSLMVTGRKLWTIAHRMSWLHPLSIETFVMVELYGVREYAIQPDYVLRRFPRWMNN